jgi:aspartyl protease family protein
MEPHQQARLLYLLLLGAALLFVLSRSGLRLSAALRTLLLWGAIIAALAAGYALVAGPEEPAVTVVGDTIEIRRGGDGHFHATLGVNGTPVHFMVDTGATDIVLSADDARAAGIDTEALTYFGRAQTANGIVRTAPVRLDSLSLANRTDANVRASVNEGAMGVSLLGMAYLDRFGRIEIAGDTLRLIP